MSGKLGDADIIYNVEIMFKAWKEWIKHAKSMEVIIQNYSSVAADISTLLFHFLDTGSEKDVSRLLEDF
jgi:hypothetical protein